MFPNFSILYGFRFITTLEELAIILKKDVKIPVLCCLASNVFQQFQLLTDGSLKKTFSSLKYLQLSGSKDQTFVLELDCKKQVLLNASDIIFWLMD